MPSLASLSSRLLRIALPAWLIDVLVAINIAVGVILLLLGVYIASPLEFSAFPSVLLLTTLFRLSVSIATKYATSPSCSTWTSGTL